MLLMHTALMLCHCDTMRIVDNNSVEGMFNPESIKKKKASGAGIVVLVFCIPSS